MELLRFSAESYINLNRHLTDLESELNGEEVAAFPDATDLTGKRLPLNEKLKGDALRLLKYSRIMCAQINLTVCVKHTEELLRSVEAGWLGAADVQALMANVTRELSSKFFIGIASERQAIFENGRKGWEDVASAFPDAGDDIEEMNKCFALCRYPSAVMHSLLAVEHGLVAFGKRIGVTDPKEGWDASCRELERIIKSGRGANATGLDFSQLEQLNACLQSMKLSWRNKVNHATGKPVVMHGGFAPDVAEEILQASRGFLRRLKIVLGL